MCLRKPYWTLFMTAINDSYLSTWSVRLGDRPLFGIFVALMGLGLVVMASASVDVTVGGHQTDTLYFLWRQLGFLAVALVLALMVLYVPLVWWQRGANAALVATIIALIAVLFAPEVNKVHRWLKVGPLLIQVSELAKLGMVIYFAAFLAKHAEWLQRDLSKVLIALIPLAVVSGLILKEPDLGTVVVLSATVIGMFFMAGLRWRYLVVLVSGAAVSFVALIVTKSYRMARVESFLDPCRDEFMRGSGYQLCHSLVAFGRGEWFGVGLGGGVQKLSHLPEAYNDFVFAILAEELGAVGSLTVIVLYCLVIWRGLYIALRAQHAGQVFNSMLAYGITFWLGGQAFINMAVNMALVPPKGLTLPLISYGGSSLVVTIVGLALLLRVAYEARDQEPVRWIPWKSASS